MRRVVVTGLGLVTPLGCGVKTTWDNILAGKSGLGPITSFDVSDLPARIAGNVPRGTNPGEFNVDEWIPVKESRVTESRACFINVSSL